LHARCQTLRKNDEAKKQDAVMLEPPKNLLRPVVSDIHRRSFVFVDIYRSKSECIIKLINVRSFTKAFGICRHSPANVDIHYFRTLTVTYILCNCLRIRGKPTSAKTAFHRTHSFWRCCCPL
jgi:hypothetical protein